MGATIITIIGAVLASNALFGFIQFVISRRDTKKNIADKITCQLLRQEKDILRTQLLVLISLRPEEQQEILTVAERYFSPEPKGLDGNWYMTSLFNKWLSFADIAEPDWFDSQK